MFLSRLLKFFRRLHTGNLECSSSTELQINSFTRLEYINELYPTSQESAEDYVTMHRPEVCEREAQLEQQRLSFGPSRLLRLAARARSSSRARASNELHDKTFSFQTDPGRLPFNSMTQYLQPSDGRQQDEEPVFESVKFDCRLRRECELFSDDVVRLHVPGGIGRSE
ncbi:MAG TPA: hypothetical protein V6C89_08520 [Drouetiella sp.]